MTPRTLSIRPARWVFPAAVVAGCLGSLPLWLGDEHAQPVGDPVRLAGVLFGESWIPEDGLASPGALPAAALPASH